MKSLTVGGGVALGDEVVAESGGLLAAEGFLGGGQIVLLLCGLVGAAGGF